MVETRRLATIIFADIAGYTALMQEDEAKALEYLDGFKKVTEAETGRFQGRIIQYFGDACLLSFDSSTSALNCALSMQQGFRYHNNIPVRIGIHLGEVVYTENNAFGDGVNIASRIESLGVSGAILVSKPVFDQVRNKHEFIMVSMGRFDFKNVKEPLEVFALANPGIIVPRKEEMTGKLKPKESRKVPAWLVITVIGILLGSSSIVMYSWFMAGKSEGTGELEKSIAVLPFRNDSPDENNVYFCNGIMEGVLDNLAKIPDLSVVSRTSVEQYRENPPSTTEIAKQLGVNYILEGSVMKVDNRCVIRAQLIYATEDKQLWSDQFDKELEDIFSVLAEVTQTIAEKLKATISPEVLKNIEIEPTTDLTAYDYYLQGKEYFNYYEIGGRDEDLENADRLFRIALNKDSTYALAYVGRARILREQHQYEFYNNDHLIDSLLNLCNEAISYDPAAADAYWIRGSFYDDFLFEIPKAEADLKKALEINPNHVGAIRQMAWLVRYHHKDVIAALRLMKKLEKLDRSAKELNMTYGSYAWLYWDIGYWEKGLKYIQKAIELEPNWLYNESWYFVLQGDVGEAIRILKDLDEDTQSYCSAMGLYCLLAKEYEQSLAFYETWARKVKEDGPADASGVKDWHRYGEVLVAMGREEEGLQFMRDQLELNEKLLTKFQSGYEIYYNNAGIYAFLNNKKMAYKFLRKFDESNRWESNIYFVQIDPLFDNIRNDEEFKAIVNKELEENREIREKIDMLELAGEL